MRSFDSERQMRRRIQSALWGAMGVVLLLACPGADAGRALGTRPKKVAPRVAPTPVTRLRGDRFLLDLRYNTPDNFLGRNVYREFGLKECFVLRRVKQGVLRIVPELRKRKLKLVLLDCWRPIEVQRKMWELVPIPGYVADPAKGSNHNRGVALDVTLARENGKRLAMPTKFDDFTPKAHRDYRCAPQEKEKCANRKLLEGLMRKAGLRGLSTEWWHFQLPEAFEEAEQFPILDQVSGPRGQ